MRISRVTAGTVVTGAAMAAVLGAFQLTSGGSHPAGNRPAVSVNHGSQVDFNGNGNASDESNPNVQRIEAQCAQELSQTQDPAAQAAIRDRCNQALAEYAQQASAVLAPSDPPQNTQPSTPAEQPSAPPSNG